MKWLADSISLQSVLQVRHKHVTVVLTPVKKGFPTQKSRCIIEIPLLINLPSPTLPRTLQPRTRRHRPTPPQIQRLRNRHRLRRDLIKFTRRPRIIITLRAPRTRTIITPTPRQTRQYRLEPSPALQKRLGADAAAALAVGFTGYDFARGTLGASLEV
jgi:hypothetical protein